MQNTYEEYALEYARFIAEEERGVFSPDRDMLLPVMFGLMGDLKGVNVLDAGCGEGRLSRILASHGARVCGIDISPTLVELARQRSEGLGIDYRVANLEQPIPELKGKFELIVSHLVIDDVPDYAAFIRAMSTLCSENGKIILSKNNPYSAVVRDKVKDYFDSGTAVLYHGLSGKGVKVYYYHRTLEEYVAAFRKEGFLLSKLSDVEPPMNGLHDATSVRESTARFRHFPFFMVLEFIKVKNIINERK